MRRISHYCDYIVTALPTSAAAAVEVTRAAAAALLLLLLLLRKLLFLWSCSIVCVIMERRVFPITFFIILQEHERKVIISNVLREKDRCSNWYVADEKEGSRGRVGLVQVNGVSHYTVLPLCSQLPPNSSIHPSRLDPFQTWQWSSSPVLRFTTFSFTEK